MNSKKEIVIKAGQALYGERWQTDLSRDLGFSDGRRIRQWMSGDRPIPDSIYDDLSKLLEERQLIINEVVSIVNKKIG